MLEGIACASGNGTLCLRVVLVGSPPFPDVGAEPNGLGQRTLPCERTCLDVVDHREAIRTLVDDTAIWNPLTREVFDMCSTVRAAVPAATAMYDLANIGYRFAIGPEKCAVSESKSFFPHRESSLTIRADVDASVRLVEHTLDDPSRYRALRAPRREEDSSLDLGSGFARDQEKKGHRRPPHRPTVAAGT
jgi:hypothetical protein